MKRLLFGLILTFVLIIGQTGVAFAQDTTLITGTVQSVVLETDTATGQTTVVVTYTFTDSAGVTQTATARLSVETAAGPDLKVVTTDPNTNTTTVNPTAIGSTVNIDPATVIPAEEEKEHPVGSALANFFSELLGVDYETIMEYHENGTGFGVITQALWLTNQLGGDTSTFTALLDAKKSGDYSGITLADGSTPGNWGEVVKSLKKGENLGSVKSGKVNSNSTSTDQTNGNGNDKGNGNSKNGNDDSWSSNGNGGGNGNSGNNNGGGNGGGKGSGKGGEKGGGKGNGGGKGKP